MGVGVGVDVGVGVGVPVCVDMGVSETTAIAVGGVVVGGMTGNDDPCTKAHTPTITTIKTIAQLDR